MTNRTCRESNEEGFAVERFKQIDFVPEIRGRVFDPQVLERIEYEEIWVMRLMNLAHVPSAIH